MLTDLRARYVTAEKDLPDRRLRLGLAEQTVARVLTRIDHASEQDPARLVLSDGSHRTTSRSDGAAIGRRSGPRCGRSWKSTRRSRRCRWPKRESRTVTGVRRSDDRRLDRGHRDRSSGDDATRSRAADRIRRERADELDDRLIELRPWTGDRNSSARHRYRRKTNFSVGHRSKRTLLSKSLRGKASRIASPPRQDASMQESRRLVPPWLASSATRKPAKRGPPAKPPGPFTRRSWMQRRPLAFETAMRKLDLITEQRFSHTARIAELNSALLEQSRGTGGSGADADASCRRACGRRAAMAEEIEKALRAIGHGLEITSVSPD